MVTHSSGAPEGRARVLIGPSSFAAVDTAPLDRLRAAGFDVVENPYGRKLTERELRELLAGVVGLIAGLEPLTRDVLAHSELRAIARSGAGMSNVDLEAAASLGIRVSNTPDAPTTAVAELTLGALLALLRHIAALNAGMHQRQWSRAIGGQLEGRTVAVVGYGRIGRRVAELVRAFRASVIVVDPNVTNVDAAVTHAALDDALGLADIVTVHASGDAAIIGARALARVKPGVLLLNAGRGGLIDETALQSAIDSGVVAGAWLDTFCDEPYAGPLCSYPQVLLTPHIGSLTAECRRRMEAEAVDNLLAALADASAPTHR
jgi:D-3-phosphoglycerate dehydrogenase